jgi:hypothetical protein
MLTTSGWVTVGVFVCVCVLTRKLVKLFGIADGAIGGMHLNDENMSQLA